jgi:two-component system, LytTR family, response regulator LytT
MMKVLIVEDEELATRKLKNTLQSLDSDIDVVGSTESITGTVEWLQKHESPDLILMDIELTDGQSFEIFNRINVNSPVIFTTSYDEFALKAFKVNSVDYLLKPVQKDELAAAIEKLRNLKGRYAEHGTADPKISDFVKVLQKALQQKEFRTRFLVRHAQKLVSVEIDTIAYFYSDDKINFFTTFDDKNYVVDYTLDEIESMVDPVKFFRVGRAFLVSSKSIEQIHDYFGNRLKLQLKPSTTKETLVSREKVSEFKKWLGK